MLTRGGAGVAANVSRFLIGCYNVNREYGSRVDVGGEWEAYINSYGSFDAKRGPTTVGVHPHIDAEQLGHEDLLEIGRLVTSRL